MKIRKAKLATLHGETKKKSGLAHPVSGGDYTRSPWSYRTRADICTFRRLREDFDTDLMSPGLKRAKAGLGAS